VLLVQLVGKTLAAKLVEVDASVDYYPPNVDKPVEIADWVELVVYPATS